MSKLVKVKYFLFACFRVSVVYQRLMSQLVELSAALKDTKDWYDVPILKQHCQVRGHQEEWGGGGGYVKGCDQA